MIWLEKKDNETSRDVLVSYLKHCETQFSNEIHAFIESREKQRQIDNSETISNQSINFHELGSITHPPDFVVLSHEGRKPSLKQEKMLRNTIELALHHIKQSIILVKQNFSGCIKSKSYIMAVNETEVSKKGLQVLFTLIHPNDSLELIYVFRERSSGCCETFDCYGEDTLREVKTYYEKQLLSFGPIKNAFTVLHTNSLGTLVGANNNSAVNCYRKNSFMDISQIPADLQLAPRFNNTSPSRQNSQFRLVPLLKTDRSYRNIEKINDTMVTDCGDSRSNFLTDNMIYEKAKISSLNQIPITIIDYVNRKSDTIDFFAIAPRPRGDIRITTNAITETILTQLDCNIILCKE
jgi:hypothetical protein